MDDRLQDGVSPAFLTLAPQYIGHVPPPSTGCKWGLLISACLRWLCISRSLIPTQHCSWQTAYKGAFRCRTASTAAWTLAWSAWLDSCKWSLGVSPGSVLVDEKHTCVWIYRYPSTLNLNMYWAGSKEKHLWWTSRGVTKMSPLVLNSIPSFIVRESISKKR